MVNNHGDRKSPYRVGWNPFKMAFHSMAYKWGLDPNHLYTSPGTRSSKYSWMEQVSPLTGLICASCLETAKDFSRIGDTKSQRLTVETTKNTQKYEICNASPRVY